MCFLSVNNAVLTRCDLMTFLGKMGQKQLVLINELPICLLHYCRH